MRYWRVPEQREKGLTLIELMVAMAIFSVLGVLSYRALSAASSSESRLGESVRRWEALSCALGRVESEFSDSLLPFIASPSNLVEAVQLQPPTGEVKGELHFLRLDDGLGARRVAFRQNGLQLEWLLWEGREAVGQPQVEVLLDGVRALRWRFYDQGQRYGAWPPDVARHGRLPAGIGIEIDLAELGTFERVFALR